MYWFLRSFGTIFQGWDLPSSAFTDSSTRRVFQLETVSVKLSFYVSESYTRYQKLSACNLLTCTLLPKSMQSQRYKLTQNKFGCTAIVGHHCKEQWLTNKFSHPA